MPLDVHEPKKNEPSLSLGERNAALHEIIVEQKLGYV